MKRSLSHSTDPFKRWAQAVLAIVALLFVARAGWLARLDSEESHRTRAQVVHVQPVDRPVDKVAEGNRASSSGHKRLTDQEFAAIAGLCPTAVSELPREILPLSALGPVQAKQLATEAEHPASIPDQARSIADSARPPTDAIDTHAKPRGRLTGIRLASRDPATGLADAGSKVPEGWLVAPEAWFAPEDDALLEESTTEEEAPQVETESAAEPSPAQRDQSADKTPTQPSPPRINRDDAAREPLPEQEDQPGPGFAPPGVAMPERSDRESASTDRVESISPESPVTEVAPWEGPFDAIAPPEERSETIEEVRENAEVEPDRSAVESDTAGDSSPDRQTAPQRVSPLFDAPAGAEQLSNQTPADKPSADVPEIKPPGSLFAAPQAEPRRAAGGKAAHAGAGAVAKAEAKQAADGKSADESHRELFAKNNYPSAQDCAACHQRIYDEWSVSSHAYAFVSPMYHKFEQTITDLSQGTVGHFCQRCHSPVATAMYEPRSMPISQMAGVAREGVTCIACHRVNQRWGKTNGDRRIVPGDVYDPVYGGVGGDGVAAVIADKQKYKVKTSEEEKGPSQAIHTEGRFFDQLTQAEACTSCHQVAVQPGVKLEVVWEQYRASPACKKGITCQDCHMGRIPGVAAGYNYGPISELNGKTVNNQRKQSSHIFYGPGYSIAHPGIFPHNPDADDWTVDEWLLFDWRAGWGTDEFEEKLEELEDAGTKTDDWFPKVWAEVDDRYDAREIIEDNLKKLANKRRYRELVMENGSKVDGPFFAEEPAAGQDLNFEYVVANLNEGHNLPTASLGAQPQLWANVVLIDPHGRRVWESGYTDSNGDLCDIHSVDVRKGHIPFDKQLFNLQTMFLITGATGTDREFYLPVNLDIDQVAHLRPGTLPISVLNHPPFIRMEMRSLAPLGRKRVKYTVPAELMRLPGRYRLSFRMRNRTEPMYFMRLCNSTPEMLRAMTEGTLDIHPQSVEFEVR